MKEINPAVCTNTSFLSGWFYNYTITNKLCLESQWITWDLEVRLIHVIGIRLEPFGIVFLWHEIRLQCGYELYTEKTSETILTERSNNKYKKLIFLFLL